MARTNKTHLSKPKARMVLQTQKIARKSAPVQTGVKRRQIIKRKTSPCFTGRKDYYPINNTYKKYVKSFKSLQKERRRDTMQLSSNMLTQHFHRAQQLTDAIQETYRHHFYPISHFLTNFAVQMTRMGSVMTLEQRRALRNLLPSAYVVERFFNELQTRAYEVSEQIGQVVTPSGVSTLMQRNQVDELLRRASTVLQAGQVRMTRRQTQLDVYLTAAMFILNQVQGVFQGIQSKIREYLGRIIVQQSRLQDPIPILDDQSSGSQSNSQSNQEINENPSQDSDENDSKDEDSKGNQGQEQILIE